MASSKKQEIRAKSEIAVIGIGCYYPGAKSPLELWENILARRQQFREMPDVRLPNMDYYDSDPSVPDKTYQNKAAVIDGYEFNWLDRRIPKRTYESTDIVHWLALDTALQAIADAKLSKETIPTEKTGVVLGNTLTGEFTRSNQMLLRWPYVRKTLRLSLKKKGIYHLVNELEPVMEKYYKSVFAPVTEDTLAGGLANTIAGRICNFLDLHGGGYIVDGACSSSLLAITSAANYLELGQMDIAIAGGVDISLDTFELIGFAKTGALTRDEMRVYDKKGQGFLPGEGCGMVVLKRMEDALRDGDTIYSTLMGWGISSDGKGGITAPSAVGQSRALLRAYRKAGFDPENLDFIEGHGTGTTVGDKIELEGITIALNADKSLPQRNCGVTSFKSIVGHTKAAAGVGAFIKTVIALNQRIIPPTAGLKEYNPIFEDKAKTLYPVIFGSKREANDILYAGVSAMGFGGINSHVLLRSGSKLADKFKPAIDERKLMVSNQESEVFVFAADSIEELIHELELCSYMSNGISYAEMADFAYYLNTSIHSDHPFRAAIVARTPFELKHRINLLIDKLSALPAPKQLRLEGNTISFGIQNSLPRIGIAFPGQGAQRINMTYKMKERFEWVRELYSEIDSHLTAEGFDTISDKLFRPFERIIDQREKIEWNDLLKQTQLAQPAITANSLIWYKFLTSLGLKFDYAIGHSLGELSAFFAAGLITEADLIKFAGYRGKVMSQCGSGTMASLVCPVARAEEFISKIDGYLTIANINAPEQTVVSGDEEAINKLIKLANESEIAAVKLPVSAAFHSKLIADASEALRKAAYLKTDTKQTTGCQIISTVTADLLASDANLADYFATQAVSQVRFTDAVKRLEECCDLVVEVGPGKVLSGLISSINGQTFAFPVEAAPNDDISFNILIANLFAAGATISMKKLYENRLVRPFVPVVERKFLTNPLERPIPDFNSLPQTKTVTTPIDVLLNDSGIPAELFSDYLSQRGNFIREVIASDIRHFRPGTNLLPEKEFELVPITETVVAEQPEPAMQTFEKGFYANLETVTGFPAHAFTPEMKLLDDLNLDSIKAGTLLSGMAKTYGISGKINPVNYANSSLGNIVEDFKKHIPEQVQAPKTTAPVISVEEELVKMVAERTGFPAESISMDFRLLNDLNLDSIKAGTLIGQLFKQFEVKGKIEAATLSNASLAEIAKAITLHSAKAQNLVKAPSEGVSDIGKMVVDLISERTGFSSEHLGRELKLLDDLNLDSIKAGELIGALARKLNVSQKISIPKYSNASIATIISDFKAVVEPGRPETKVQKEVSSSSPGWVRSFEVVLEEKEIDISESQITAYWRQRNVTIACNINNQQIADYMCNELVNICRSCSVTDINKIGEFNPGQEAHLLILILPSGITTQQVAETTAVLSGLAANPNLFESDLCFIQEGDGRFYRYSLNEPVSSLSATAFAASLHLERPGCTIRVLDPGQGANSADFSISVIVEMANDVAFEAVGYSSGKRYLMAYKLSNPQKAEMTSIPGTSDVVLITGGAKGITAECGLALARKFRNKTILLGSSKLTASNTEVNSILERYKAEGLEVAYFACDIGDAVALRNLKGEMETALGKISIIIHGAGRNVPRLASAVDANEALSEITPKVFGTANLIEVFKASNIKQFTLFSSIIGVTGMKGNAWYAFANETSDRLLRQFGYETGSLTLSLAYSVWSEVGMGARMGSIDTLANMGISAISPEKGIAAFLEAMESQYSDQQLIVASRLGGLDTWKRAGFTEMPRRRYIDEVIYLEPGVEIEVYTNIDRTGDLYLDDHNYRGSLLFPTVFGVEAMAQAVAMLCGKSELPSVTIENISLKKPVVAPSEGSTRIKISAVSMDDKQPGLNRIFAGISTEDSNFTENHFSAEFVLGDPEPAQPVLVNTCEPLLIDSRTDLYSWLLFQGKTFQLIDKVYNMSDSKVLFSTRKIVGDTSEICLSETMQEPFILGSPLLRDTLLQSFQLSLTKKLVLPVQIGRWTIRKQNSSGEPALVACTFKEQQGKTYSCNVNFYTYDGTLLETIENYQVQELGDKSAFPTPEEIAGIGFKATEDFLGVLPSGIGYILPSISISKHRKLFHTLNSNDRHAIEQQIIDNNRFWPALTGYSPEDLKLSFDTKGKPQFASDKLSISISHSNTWLFITAGEFDQGCDIELIQHREEETWRDLLGNDWYSATLKLKAKTNASYDEIASRFWSLKEAYFKLTGHHQAQSELMANEGSYMIFRLNTGGSPGVFLASTIIPLYPGVQAAAAFSVTKAAESPTTGLSEDAQPGENSESTLFDFTSGRFVHHFKTSFKDCRNFYGKTYFTNFPVWMGSLREYVLKPLKDELMRDLGSGEFGMVTNTSGIRIYNEAEALDTIKGTLQFTPACDFDNSYIDLRYEWFKQKGNDFVRLADCTLSTTWVTIVDRGLVQKSPIPDYFLHFLKGYYQKMKPESNSLAISPESLLNLSNAGLLHYESEIMPRPKILLSKKQYQTGLINGNTVGNLYYSNYYDWQAQQIESFLYSLVPDLFRGNGTNGEYFCTESTVNHLQEAMPFEEIEVEMYLWKVYENALGLYFEYYTQEGKSRRKLAFGTNTVIWASRKQAGDKPQATRLPEQLKAFLNKSGAKV